MYPLVEQLWEALLEELRFGVPDVQKQRVYMEPWCEKGGRFVEGVLKICRSMCHLCPVNQVQDIEEPRPYM